MQIKIQSFAAALIISALSCPGILLVEGCSKKVAVATPPPTQPSPVASSVPEAKPAVYRPDRPTARPAQTAAAARRPGVPDQATRVQIQTLLDRIQDAFFDYNTANIRPDAQAALHSDAQTLAEILRGYPDYKLTVQGYADERGSSEYNLGLGEARAGRARQFLVNSGIPAQQVLTVSFGKEHQLCTEHEESCWQKNRRIHITQAQI